ncbi:MAG: YceI family protein [Parvularculaceae bacterium]
MRGPVLLFAVCALASLLQACSKNDADAAAPAAPEQAAAEAPAEATASAAETQSGLQSQSVAAASVGSAPVWTVDYAASRLGFTATQSGAAFEGEFEKFDAKIALDPDNPATAMIEVTIDMTSAATGDQQRDTALPGSDWFKVREFPSARYVATKVVRAADGSFVAEGDLTIRGVTKPLPLPFTLVIAGDAATAKGEATLMRTDFGVGEGEFADGAWVGLDVKVTIDIRATR